MPVDPNIEDLQAVSEHVLIATELIEKLEREKRTVQPGTPRFMELSEQIEKLASEVRIVSASETDLAENVAGQPGLPTIEEADAEAAAEQ